eukprot:scaffold3848_cov64-Cyclotella_meneghiniana.AAC.2
MRTAIFTRNHPSAATAAPMQWRQPNQAAQSIGLDPLDNPLAPIYPWPAIASATAPTRPSIFGYF